MSFIRLIVRNFSKERANKCVKPGAAIVYEGAPHRVLTITQGKKGKGGGFVRAKLKSLINKSVFEKTFLSDETVEIADVEKEMSQFGWVDGNQLVFMNKATFDEIRVPIDIEETVRFLVAGLEVKLMKFGNEVIGFELPQVSEYTVVSVDDTSSR